MNDLSGTIRSFLAVLLLVSFYLAWAVPGTAATIEVGGTCSLPDAITAANTNVSVNTCTAGDVSGTDVLLLLNQFTTLDTVNNNTQGANGLPPISSVIKIRIDDINGAYIDRDTGGPEFRFFYVEASGSLILQHVSLRYGAVTSGNTDQEKSGGAIFNLGSVSLDGVHLLSNSAAIGGAIYNAAGANLSMYNGYFGGSTASSNGGALMNSGIASIAMTELSSNQAGGDGGGIFNNGQLSIADTTLDNNQSRSMAIGDITQSGGAIAQAAGSLTIKNTTIYRNSADYKGSGLSLSGGTTVLSNSTISANYNAMYANAIYLSGGTIEITNSTVSEHSPQFPGDANIQNDGASISFVNSIIADDSGTACGGTISDLGNNWFQDDSCGRAGDGDPKLAPLADNGGPSTDNVGPTRTQALLPGSGAIDGGNDAICAAAPVNNLDQRGYTRPQAMHCDIGAYEVPLHTDTIVVDDVNCSLVNAIHSANLNQAVGGCAAGTQTGTDTIVLQANTLYELDAPDNGSVIAYGVNGLPEIVSSIRIQGQGSEITRAADAPMFRLFLVDTTGELILNNLSISNGLANDYYDESGRGGAIYNFGSLALENCNLHGNWAYSGGAIYNEQGSVTLQDSTLSGNTAKLSEGEGGGLNSEAGSMIISRSTLSANGAYYGGGIYAFSGASLAVYNSTLSGNSAEQGGAIIVDYASLEMLNSTLSDNSANRGGGLHAGDSTVSLGNSLIANHLQGGDCHSYSGDSGTFNEIAPNWFEDDSCNAIASGDPKLGPLADNGGTTQTHALLTGSGALDAADDGVCADPLIGGVDQRGEPRPQGAHCDIGSFESDGTGVASVPEASSFFVLPTQNGKLVIFSL